MFKKPTKQSFLIRRVLLSVLATVSVLIIVTASILFMLGYRLDSGNGRLEQGALLQFDSQPNGADVWVDGNAIGGQTATKQTVLAGVHSVKMTKQGYEDWNRTLSLDAGTLTWLDYTRLVPKNRPVESVIPYTNLASLSFSPDLKWALALENNTVATLQLIDLRSEAVKTAELILPATLYTVQQNGTSSFTPYRWNSEGRYIIVKHVYGDAQTEWLMVDTQDVNRSVNITRLLSVDFNDIQFSGTSGTSLYGLTTDGLIRKLDLSAGTISRAFVSHVSSFSMFEETNVLSYVGVDANDANKKVVGIYKDGENGPTVLRSTTDSSLALAIALGRYFSDDYVAIAEGTSVTVLYGSLPSEGAADKKALDTYASFSIKGAATNLSFSEKSDYVMAQSGSVFVSYEIEHKRTSVGVVTPAQGTPASALKWLDAAHLWNDDDGALVMRDFDGTNLHTIMPVAPGFGASLSTNGKFFYGVGKTETGYQLQRVRMILN